MNLAENITALRKQHGMSQGDLAEKLEVSRQSISKWETGASVPELDKLVALCDLFQISLDELVRDAPTQAPPEAPPEPAAPVPRTQHIIGYILLGLGILSTILGLLFLRNVFLLGMILVVYGAICLLAKKHAGLIIGWVTMLPVLLLHSSFTGIRMLSVFDPGYYENVASAACIMAWLLWLALLLLVFFTGRALRKK